MPDACPERFGSTQNIRDPIEGMGLLRLNGQFAECGTRFVAVFDARTAVQRHMHVEVLKRS